MLPDLSIVILSWNVRELLAACLDALPEAAGAWWVRCEVIVVDNGSGDGSVEMVRREYPIVKVLALGENRGFSGGNNAGIRAARGRHVLLLNPDTIAMPGSIEAMSDYMEENAEVGIVGPRLLNPDGSLQPSRRRFPTLITAAIESTPLQRWFRDTSALRRFYMEDRTEGETQEVEWLSGAALFCRRAALGQVGLFDEGYFMFSEEVDLCRRIVNAGWRVVYLPSAEIRHLGGGSTEQDLPGRHINFNTSKARYFRLHEGHIAGRAVRAYLIAVYWGQLVSEAAKWVAGHKRPLRASRVALYREALASGLREQRSRGIRKRLSVLLVTGEYPPAHGGVGDYSCRLSWALREVGVGARVLTKGDETEVQAPEVSRNESVKDERSLSPEESRESTPLLSRRITVGDVVRALKGTRAQVAHIQYQTGAYGMRPTINMAPLILRARWGGATVVTFHDLLVPYLFPKAGPVREWANRLLARSAGAVVATNSQDAEKLREWGVKRMEVIPIGSNILRDPPVGYSRVEWRQKWGAGEGTVILAYFGFLNSSKGLGDLLEVLRRLQEHGDFRLVMVGGGVGSSDPTNRATAEEVARLARRLGVEEMLIWTGYVTPQEVSASLLAADVAVLPFTDGASFRRGSLLAVLEHGVPLVTTEPSGGGSSAEEWGLGTLRHGENAMLVRVGEVEAILKAILEVAQSEELRKRLQEGALELARGFGWERIAERHIRLYAGMVAGATERVGETGLTIY